MTIGELVRTSRGSIRTGPFGTTLRASEYSIEGLPVVSVGEVGYGSFRLDEHTRRVGPEVRRRLPEYELHVGDIVFGRKGAVDRSATIREEQDGWFLGSDGIRVRLGAGVDPLFVGYALQAEPTRRWILHNATGTTMASLNQRLLESLPLRVPPNAEQRAIVAALDDVSSFVTLLEGLVAKKRAIKQGMMQELLTGKTRLPGFANEWRDLKVASASHLKARIGWQGLTAAEYRSSGHYRLVGGTDFKEGRVNWSKTPFVDKWRFDQDQSIQLTPDDVLLTKDGTIGKVAFVDDLPGPATLNSGVFVIRPRQAAYHPRFLYQLLRSRVFDEFVAALSAGSTINHLYQRDLVTLNLQMPSDLSEQEAIARVLQDTDDEILILERRLTSARAIKQGMMQELLTGRTRLPMQED